MGTMTIGEVLPGLPAPETGTLPEAGAAWKLDTFAGRLAEIRGGRATAALTLTFRLVLEAQRSREPVAWITRHGTVFYPPDAAEASVDLDGLVRSRS